MALLDHKTITIIASDTNLDYIASKVSEGRCILFLGSGVHFPSADYDYDESICPPLGGKFSAHLAGECKFLQYFPNESPLNLQRVSLCYEIAKTRNALVEEVKKAVHVDKKPSPALHALAELPFSLVITTNYDQLFERALRDAGKEPQLGVYNPERFTPPSDYPNISPGEPFVFKLHGDIQKPESIVITDEDYIQFVLRMSDKEQFHPVPMTFRYHFTRWPTLFVGYSLHDYNLRLLFKTLRWKMDSAQIPPTYSVDPFPDPLIFDVWHNQKKYVTFIAQDVWKFVPALYHRVTGKEMRA